VVGDSTSRRVRQLCAEVAKAKITFHLAREKIKDFFQRNRSTIPRREAEKVENVTKEVDSAITHFEDLLDQLYVTQIDLTAALRGMDAQVRELQNSLRGANETIIQHKDQMMYYKECVEAAIKEAESMKAELLETKKKLAEKECAGWNGAIKDRPEQSRPKNTGNDQNGAPWIKYGVAAAGVGFARYMNWI